MVKLAMTFTFTHGAPKRAVCFYLQHAVSFNRPNGLSFPFFRKL